MEGLGASMSARGKEDGRGLRVAAAPRHSRSARRFRAAKAVAIGLIEEARSVLVTLIRRNALVDAGAMAFSLFLASIPLMGLAGAVVAHVLRGEPRALTMLSSLVDVAPYEVREIVDRYVERGTDQALAPVFLLGSLYLAAGAFHDAMTLFESALGARRRTWIQKRLIALGCVVALLCLLALVGSCLMLIVGGPLELFISLLEGRVFRAVGGVGPEMVAIVTLPLLAAFFRIAVHHRSPRPTIWRGAVATVALGSLASFLFASYARTLARYAVFYGSLAAVAVFLVWLWLCCIALLIGVEVNAEAERREASFVPRPPGL
jgi:membrane protein